MFKFFTNPKWYAWAYIGSVVILTSIWVQVQIDVLINEWFGEFYDMIQKALGTPNAITMQEYMGSLASFAQLAVLSIVLGLAISFLTSHFLFRWRTAMVEWYHSVYDKARTIEGASQRVQEDTIKFSRIMEGLGTSLIESVLVLVEFFPLLMTLSIGIPILWFGDWQYGLVSGAFIWAVGGTTVKIKGNGLGGRNQELALIVAKLANKYPVDKSWAFLSAGTDGRDGPTEAAGAIIDQQTCKRILQSGYKAEDFLIDNNSNAALKISEDLVHTGATGTNVADVQILVVS